MPIEDLEDQSKTATSSAGFATLVGVLICVSVAFQGVAQDSQPPTLQLSRNVPSLKVAEDLELDLLLQEPTVANPLYLNFDERGRLWVVQYRQYPWPEW